ncbi:hypothetical protein ABPG74_012009 [Tetrahymena malaccensis]
MSASMTIATVAFVQSISQKVALDEVCRNSPTLDVYMQDFTDNQIFRQNLITIVTTTNKMITKSSHYNNNSQKYKFIWLNKYHLRKTSQKTKVFAHKEKVPAESDQSISENYNHQNQVQSNLNDN